MSGKLLLCATPIGNLEDITLRVIRALREADVIAAEDTREALKLLNHLEIKKPLIAYHEHNRGRQGHALIERALAGQVVAVVSDAGMPAISDPGEELVALAVQAGVEVTVLPGPSAALAALALSGLPCGRFAFEGFLPREKKARDEHLEALKNETRTLVFFEAPHRLLKTLAALGAAFGADRRAAAARELTKKFEQVVRGGIGELLAHFTENPPRGEFALVVAGAEPKALEWSDERVIAHTAELIAQGLSRREAARRTAAQCGRSATDVYRLSLPEEPR